MLQLWHLLRGRRCPRAVPELWAFSPPCGTPNLQTSFQILLLIDIELSYINTNHEDFIGFAK